MLGVLIRASEIGRERAIALARCVHGVVVDLQSSSRRSSSSSSRRSSSSSNRNTVEEPHVFDEHNTIVGIYTPVTKRLWQQRYQWDKQRLAAAQPQTEFLPKPPTPIDVRYPFAKDPVLREHYRNPWSGVRLGRILEDMDSLAGFVAYSHSMDDSQSTRPPLLVTATVEKISFREASLSLKEDMRMTGKVIWTGKSSMDIQMELHRGSSPSSPSIIALFTFVARDPVTGRSHKVNPLSPQTEEEKQVFNTRQKVADGRKAARELTKSSGQLWTASQLDWAKALLDESRKKRDLPALANPTALFMHDTMLENTFTTQPQQRNIHGRIFGGFLMRRAFELAHSTAYLLGACRPRTVLIDEIQFKRPVEVGDLLRFRSWVLSAKATPKVEEPDRALVHVQVQAAVTKPEALESYETNTFNFLFAIKQRKAEPDGEDYLPMPTMLPGNEEEALQMCLFYGPESRERWGESEFNDQGSVSSKPLVVDPPPPRVHPRQELPLHTIILSALQDPNTAYLRLEEALNAGADPNATDTRGYTPLHVAAELGIDSMADTLLARGSSPTVLATTQCQTPLHLAARNSHDSVVKSLLRVGLGSWVDARDARGVTPLMEAFFIPLPFPVPPLDDPTGTANAHPQEQDRASQTDRRINILLALITAGANPDGIPLHRAIEAVATTPKMSDVVLAMVRAGASLGVTDGGGNTPLHAAACVGNLAIVRAMLQDSSLSPDTVRVLVGMVNAQGKTASQVAVASGYPELARVLNGNTQSDHIADNWAMNNGDADGNIDGHYINSQNENIIGEGNEDIHGNESDNEGLTELHLAARHGQENKVAELIDTAPFLIAETDQDTGGTPLHEAAKSGHVEVVEMLLARGASVDSRNRYGETPLFLAAAWGHNTVARRLLECGADPCSCNGEGRSPQDVVASRSDVAMWEMLVGLRLRRAAARGDVAGVRAALVEDASCVTLSDPETGDTALHLAARCGGRDTVIAIMDHVGLHIQGDGVSDMDRLLRIRNRAGDEPLHAAARAGQNGAIQALLLQAPVIADPDAPNGDQDGAIHVAAGEGWIETLRVLVQAGADVDRRGGRGGTALGDAACDGNAAVVRTLLELGADPDAKNSYDGNAPLHQVALWGRPGESGEVVAALLEFGADALALNDAGQTFKDIALANSHLSALSVIPSAPGSMMENSKKSVGVQEKVSSIVFSRPPQPSLKRSDSGRPVAPGVPLRAVRRETECPKSPFMVSLEDCPLYVEDGNGKNGNGELTSGNETKGEIGGVELQGEGREVKQHEFVVVEDRLLIEPDRIRIDGTYSLGEGSYGKVYRGTFDGSKVAIKVLKASFEGEGKAVAQRAVEDFKRELMVMERMRHRNIQELRGYVMTDVGPGLVSEYYARGSLVDVLKRASRRGNSIRTTAERITWVRLIGFAVDVAAGMLHMHNQRPAPIVHRDLKASNCFVDEHWRVLVGDFGMTQIWGGFQDQKGSASNVELQNPRWLAPELMGGVSTGNDGAAYTTATDVYSFGMLMYELLTWHAPWPTTTTWAIRNRVGQGLRPPLPTVDAIPAPDTPEFESSGHLRKFIGLMERCWAQNPDMRPAFREIHSVLEKILDEVYAELRAPKKDTADELSLIEL